eukprot:353222-Chlamydomonas_euryale.AAC.20
MREAAKDVGTAFAFRPSTCARPSSGHTSFPQCIRQRLHRMGCREMDTRTGMTLSHGVYASGSTGWAVVR